ncbi:hypothetical protein RHMOL_Rhmol07G0193500 [Rhododendron molle]|uniref:Uncharacterized protein n=1 Tax=Rhododendron molle TaxID=49168 RepID=A0ACC0N2M7_RHOML|nr:hypothetical protein RHMOL_Rhmol07G0193500 [Rhododendron molle]
MVCNECGQAVEPSRPQLKSVVVRPYEDRPGQWQETHQRSSVFSRIQSRQASDPRHNSEFEASSSVEKRPRIVKPRSTPQTSGSGLSIISSQRKGHLCPGHRNGITKGLGRPPEGLKGK